MRHSSHVKPISNFKANAATQDAASFEEMIALLKILALGDQEIGAGKVKPVADVVARLQSNRVA